MGASLRPAAAGAGFGPFPALNTRKGEVYRPKNGRFLAFLKELAVSGA